MWLAVFRAFLLSCLSLSLDGGSFFVGTASGRPNRCATLQDCSRVLG